MLITFSFVIDDVKKVLQYSFVIIPISSASLSTEDIPLTSEVNPKPTIEASSPA